MHVEQNRSAAPESPLDILNAAVTRHGTREDLIKLTPETQAYEFNYWFNDVMRHYPEGRPREEHDSFGIFNGCNLTLEKVRQNSRDQHRLTVTRGYGESEESTTVVVSQLIGGGLDIDSLPSLEDLQKGTNIAYKVFLMDFDSMM